MRKLLFLFVALVAGVSFGSATDGIGNLYWIGNVDANYATPANWRFGSATGTELTVAPKKNDYQANIYLTDAAPEGSRTITAAYLCNSIVVVSGTGWNYKLNGSQVVKSLTVKSGAEFTLSEGMLKNNNTTVEEGAVATVSKMYWDNSRTISGKGTLIMNAGPDGYSNSRTATIGATLVRIKANTLFSGTMGHSYIMNSKDGRIQYKGTLDAAKKLVGVSGNGKGGVLAGTGIPAGYELAVRQLDGDLSDYVEFYFCQTSQPIISAASLSRTNNGAFEVTARLSQGAEGTTIKAVADDGAGNTVESAYSGTVEVDADISFELDGLASDRTYVAKVFATNDTAADEKAIDAVFYNGRLSPALVADAFERDTAAGTVSVSRVSADAYPQTVNYAFTGVTAVEGVDYEALSGVVVIPEGEMSALIPVKPIMNASRAEDVTLRVSLNAGLYDESADPVTVTIHDFTIPSDSCVWMGGSGVDNNASTAANWYQSKLPTKDDKILLAAFSPSNIVWDAGENGLPDTVASWEQTVDYTGTVTFKTVYPNGDDTAFTNFTVTGNCIVNGGKWTHVANGDAQVNRLCVNVGGGFVLGEQAAIDASAKGYGPGYCASGADLGVHGGSRGDATKVRGNWLCPAEIGSGGRDGRYGGGAVWLVVNGAAVIDGAIHADSSSVSKQSDCAAGGSVYLQAASVTGAGSVSADALPRKYDLYFHNAGSGGRIAIVVTADETCGLPDSKLTAYGMWGSPAAGAGTIRIKTAAHEHDGKLVVASNGGTQSYGTRRPSKTQTTVVTPGETWVLDELKFCGEGVLGVPVGARLVLTNGAESVSATSIRTAGLIALGGEIDFGPGVQVLQNGWIFQADTSYTFDCDVTVKDGAAIGCLPFAGGEASEASSSFAVCNVTVAGNLTVTESGYLFADNGGPNFPYNSTNKGSHGGQTKESVNNDSYDSVFNPMLPGQGSTGGDQGKSFAGGGALILSVGGTLTLDGKASADSTASSEGRAGAGGTLNIRTKSLAGTGRGSADAFFANWIASSGFGGGGGRIAVRVEETPAEAATVWRNFTAKGAAFQGNNYASAGTVYLQTGADGEGGGTIYVKNSGSAEAWTALPSATAGGEDDVYKGASLALADNGAVKLFDVLKIKNLTMATGTKINLNGNTLKVKTAKLGAAKLAPGTYTAADCPDFLVGDGSLVVTGGAFAILVR